MSTNTARAEVTFDCVLRGLERKLESPTVSLVERILDEAGFDGQWSLRDSRRIRKKGRGRFGAIRLEARAGAKSIRIWCKPKGNDTGFEYSLCPPAGVKAEDAFSTLSRVHPVTLAVTESPELPGAVLGRIMDVPPQLQAMPKFVEVDPASEANEEVGATDDVPTESVETPQEPSSGADGRQETQDHEPTPEASVEANDGSPLLLIDEGADLWDREVADRALMAIAFVATDGIARKSDASSSIIKHLGMEGFAKGGNERYSSVQGSMRALTMAIRKKWKYIERVTYSADGGRGSSAAVKEYRITPKGRRRLEVVGDMYGPEVRSRLSAGLASTVARGVTAADAGRAVSAIDMDAIKGMVRRHDEAKRQIKEHDDVIGGLDSDIRSLSIELEGLESVEAERRRRMAEIQEELREIEEKKSSVSDKIDSKAEERRQWAEMREPYVAERDRIESALMGGRADADSSR